MPFQKGNKLGGRPKNKKTIEKEKALEYITERVVKELEPIVTKQINQAKKGDNNARTDLYNRAFGKPKESVDLNIVEFTFDEDTKLG